MTQYVCSACGYGSASWYGKCPECQEWNTFKKFSEGKKSKRSVGGSRKASFGPLDSVKPLSASRFPTNIYEFDRVLGGGSVPGEVILIGGPPGVGKSTLLVKIFSHLRTMYVSGEESADQVRHRAERVKADISRLLFTNDNEVDGLISAFEHNSEDFDVIIIDSIQTVYSASIDSPMGSVSQIKESASKLVEYAKNANKVVIIVGHITKEGDIAGPKMLEHLVDCVLYLEGERQSHYRILRARKNRYGPTDEVGIFEMRDSGLEQVEKPIELIDSTTSQEPGRALVASVEGSRALFYEIQCLVVPTALAMPRRVVSGINYNRLQLLIAVMQRHMHMKLDTYDVYVNVVGGLSSKSPGTDLGVVAAILSSMKNKPLPHKCAFIGEVGLLGEIREVFGQGKVLSNTKRFGLKKIYSSKDMPTVTSLKGIL